MLDNLYLLGIIAISTFKLHSRDTGFQEVDTECVQKALEELCCHSAPSPLE